MTMTEINDLLMQINALRDNAGDWTSADVVTCSETLQRMAANLPKLHRIAVAGWESARSMAIAHNGASTERRADDMLKELGEDA